MLPDFDGYKVLELLEEDPSTGSVPFIFLTAKAEKSEIRKGMNLGADDYLTKPFLRINATIRMAGIKTEILIATAAIAFIELMAD